VIGLFNGSVAGMLFDDQRFTLGYRSTADKSAKVLEDRRHTDGRQQEMARSSPCVGEKRCSNGIRVR
jgi:hypothetical protein